MREGPRRGIGVERAELEGRARGLGGRSYDASSTAPAPPIRRRLALLGPFAPYRGGIAHFNGALAHALEARGHAVLPLSFRRQYPALLFPGTSQMEPAQKESGQASGAEGPARVLDTLNPLSWRRAVREVRAWRADAAVFPYWMSFFAPMWGHIARGLAPGVPSMGLVHNAIGHEPRPGERALARYALSPCAGLVTLSERVASDVEALGLGAIPSRRVAHPAYRQFGGPLARGEARRALGLPPEAPILLFFGFVRAYKGLSVLLDAMPILRGSLPDARLVVAGEFYDDLAPYEAQVARLGLAEAVRIEDGYAPAERVRLLFSAADLVVQPYVSATQSGVAQVAFGLGRPVLTTDVGGLAEAVGEGGMVVPPQAPRPLAEAAARFFREGGLRQRLEAGARAMGEADGWEAVAEAVEALVP